MKVTITDDCISCGLCSGACPELFAEGSDGMAHPVIQGEIPGDLIPQAIAAEDDCPVFAITVEG